MQPFHFRDSSCCDSIGHVCNMYNGQQHTAETYSDCHGMIYSNVYTVLWLYCESVTGL